MWKLVVLECIAHNLDIGHGMIIMSSFNVTSSNCVIICPSIQIAQNIVFRGFIIQIADILDITWSAWTIDTVFYSIINKVK